jgi:hypothetical protein
MNSHICVFFKRPWIKNNRSHIIAFRIRPLRSHNTVGFMRKDRKYEKKAQGVGSDTDNYGKFNDTQGL